MISTRRQFGRTFAAVAAAGLIGGPLARAQDDDRPLNIFISPPGQPFRAPWGAPYPVVDWFKQADKNGDGKLDRTEFLADAEAFFKLLDLNGDGVLSAYEIANYERRIAPEILGIRLDEGALQPRGVARLWLAQAPRGDASDAPPMDEKKGLDESQQGASPYGFFGAPEPVTAADFRFRGMVLKDDFMKLAGRHFATLDSGNEGFLTLAKLPKTSVQIRLEHKGGLRL